MRKILLASTALMGLAAFAPSAQAQTKDSPLDDNVGGYVLDAAIGAMKQRGRIVICGQLADYNAAPDQRYGTRRVHEFIGKRLRMEGLVVFDFAERYAKAHTDMMNWIESGELKYREHVVDGLDALPELFCAQLRGEIIGRPLARLVT